MKNAAGERAFVLKVLQTMESDKWTTKSATFQFLEIELVDICLRAKLE